MLFSCQKINHTANNRWKASLPEDRQVSEVKDKAKNLQVLILGDGFQQSKLLFKIFIWQAIVRGQSVSTEGPFFCSKAC
jgi:hypothetical protein